MSFLEEVNSGGVELGGNDFVNSGDEGEFVVSGISVSFPSGGFVSAVSGLLGESILGGGQFGDGFSEDVLLEGEGTFVLGEGGFGFGLGVGDVGSGGDDFTEEFFVVGDGGFFVSSVGDEGFFEVVFEVFEDAGDLGEGFSVEAGGDLGEGEDGVGSTDLFELGEDGEVGGSGGDVGEFFEDHFEGTDNFFSLGGSGGIGEGVGFTFFSEGDFSVVEDFQLFGLVGDVTAEGGDFGFEEGDFTFGVVTLNGGNVDSAVEFGDLGFALEGDGSVDVVSFVVLEG